MTRTSKAPRNYELVKGVPRYSRAEMYGRSGKFSKKEWKPVAKPETKAAPVTKDFCGGKRVIAEKAPKWYPTEDLPAGTKQKSDVKKTPKKTKLRSSITPGTVLILLSGRFEGKRVVFLKQLDSGLLLVSGPFKVNGVPLRRVNQAYVIATSTKVDVSKVNTEKLNDAYFKRPKQAATKKSGEFFAEENKAKNVISDERKADQKAVDTALLAAVNATPSLKAYLGARFTLTNGQFPHALQF